MKTKQSIFALFAGSILLVQSCAPAEEKKEEVARDPQVEIGVVEQTTFIHRIDVQGNIETEEDVMLTAEMGGLITSVKVKEGQRVSKGAIIATVDAAVLASNMNELRTQLEYAKYMLGKQEELNKRGVGSEFDLETAKNQVKSLESRMSSIGTQQGKAVIRAPFSGVIDQVYVTTGSMAGPAAPVVRLVNSNSVDVIATISEKHFSSVKEGTPMTVTFPNYTDTVMQLKITNVGNYIEPTNRTFRVKSTINKNTLLLPNMLAEISIVDMEVPNGIVIPSTATLKDQNNNDFVYILVKEGGKITAKKVVVEVIERYEGKTLIASGVLKAGQEVVTKGARGIADGTAIRIRK